MDLTLRDKTLVRPPKDSTPASEVPAAPELGNQDPSESLTAKKAVRKKAVPKIPVKSRGEEVLVQSVPEQPPSERLPKPPLENALQHFRESFINLKNEIQKAILGYDALLTDTLIAVF